MDKSLRSVEVREHVESWVPLPAVLPRLEAEVTRWLAANGAFSVSDSVGPFGRVVSVVARVAADALPKAAVAGALHDWAPTRWWRVVSPLGEVWCEASDEFEARSRARPGDRVFRMCERTVREWREVITCA